MVARLQSEDKDNEQLRAHAHMKMSEVAYFLNRLDERRRHGGQRQIDPWRTR